ncbi:hypothetical protein CRV08_12375 [Halarcobacter ebronensis]|uniref:Sugar O-methyltransferase n=1 Tax=Halarcobacter ebronensis TaxID=1462615 RepID=A0A4V1LR15_9BACT|nr:putative sugar O-methyltransferase [Halarcobacter ebronensis]RXJ66618.1 hypothetical protein CRV08_12375 [Halarcobacter ebronensis]
MEIKSIEDIKLYINELIELREKKYKTHITNASKIWSKWLEILSFPRDLTNESLDKIRLHTGFGFFLGSNWSTCYYEKNELELGIKEIKDSKYIQDYEKLTKSTPKEFYCSEIDKNRDLISIKYKDKYINEDVLRFQSTLSNLVCLKDKQINTYLEIGAGYGGFSNQFFKHFNPKQTIIIDHPEVLFWSMTYTFINNPDKKISLITEKDQIINDSDFLFVPAFLTDCLINHKIDFVINENSFCEMTKEQIDYYLTTLNFDLLYSNNRNRQFMNFEVDSLNEILLNKFKSIPETSFYDNFYKKEKNKHNLKYHFFISSNPDMLPSFNPKELNGLSVREKF